MSRPDPLLLLTWLMVLLGTAVWIAACTWVVLWAMT